MGINQQVYFMRKNGFEVFPRLNFSKQNHPQSHDNGLLIFEFLKLICSRDVKINPDLFTN
jgi:hypothetical protein